MPLWTASTISKSRLGAMNRDAHFVVPNLRTIILPLPAGRASSEQSERHFFVLFILGGGRSLTQNLSVPRSRKKTSRFPPLCVHLALCGCSGSKLDVHGNALRKPAPRPISKSFFARASSFPSPARPSKMAPSSSSATMSPPSAPGSASPANSLPWREKLWISVKSSFYPASSTPIAIWIIPPWPEVPPPKKFTDWIPRILAAKAEWSYSDYAASWLTGAKMLLRSGTTTVADIETAPNCFPTSGTPPRSAFSRFWN